MCSPIAAGAVAAITTAAAAITTGIQERKNAKYDAQIAATNARIAVSQGKKEEQTGIELAREEKIKGLRQANIAYAQNAANGFDINSATNLYNIEDIYKESENSALNIQNIYNSKAENYYSQASNYNSKRQNAISNYNSSLLNKALGTTSKVASSWGKFSGNSNGGYI